MVFGLTLGKQRVPEKSVIQKSVEAIEQIKATAVNLLNLNKEILTQQQSNLFVIERLVTKNTELQDVAERNDRIAQRFLDLLK